MTGTSPDLAGNNTDSRTSKPTQACRSPDFWYLLVSSVSFATSSPLSLSTPQHGHHRQTQCFVIPLYLWMQWSWVNTNYSIHWVQYTLSTAYTKHRIHRVQHSPSTVYFQYNIHQVQHTPSTEYTEYSLHQVHCTPSTVCTKYSIYRVQHTASTPYTEYSIHRVQHTPSTAYTEYSIHGRFSVFRSFTCLQIDTWMWLQLLECLPTRSTATSQLSMTVQHQQKLNLLHEICLVYCTHKLKRMKSRIPWNMALL